MNTSTAFGLSVDVGQATRAHRAYSAVIEPRFRFELIWIARLLTSVPKLTTASPVLAGVIVTPPDWAAMSEIDPRSVSAQIVFAEALSLPALTAPLAILPSVTALPAILPSVTALPAILLSVTAPFLMFLVFTAFLPSLTAAKAVPPTARQSARIATTIAGEGRRRNLFSISLSSYFIGGGVDRDPSLSEEPIRDAGHRANHGRRVPG